eukprot:NODE_235_length_11996_cov_1.212070.p8 type:complete len:117 gc:universal NODE_235_length_11996_cov_1.212070:8182-8532(+)
MDVECIRRMPDMQQALFVMNYSNYTFNERIDNCNDIANDLIAIINKSANEGCPKTRKYREISSAKLASLQTSRLSNNDNSNRILNKARKLALKKYKSNMNSLDPPNHESDQIGSTP